MTELQVLDPLLVKAIQELMGNVNNDVDQYHSVDQIQGLVIEHELAEKGPYKTILQSVCDLLREKGYPRTADILVKDWHL